MDWLRVTRRAWIGVALLTALMVVVIARAHYSGPDRPTRAIHQ
jgi:hypothetical protein